MRLAIAAALALAGACTSSSQDLTAAVHGTPVRDVRVPDSPDAVPDTYSNVEAGDYVGPETCGECHAEKYGRWRKSLHATMNRRAEEAGAIRGAFDGARVAYGGGTARFERVRGAAVMTLVTAAGIERRFEVTRTIGTRYLQQYVGVELGGDGTELRLPFGWWVRQARWFPEPYFDSWYDDEYDLAGAPVADAFTPDPIPWATRCAWCHNTYPFELRARRDVGHGLEQFVELVPPRPAIDRPLDPLVTVGVSCESCHLGGREHAEEDREIRFTPSSPLLRARSDAPDLSGGRYSAVAVNAICAQCHSTPAPRYPDGSSVRNSSEALDLLAGACASAIKCTDCHDPHDAGPGPGAPDPARTLAACGGCHGDLPADHGRHTGVSCLDCHMPRIVEGLSTFVRSHRISSPTDPAMLEVGAPNACNLCHLDRSIRWTLAALETGWGRRLRAAPGWLPSYGGDLDAPVGPAWLGDDVGAVRITAAAAYARSPLGPAALPQLLAILDDPVAFTRMFLLFAIEDLVGRRLAPDEYDPLAPPARRADQVRGIMARCLPARPARTTSTRWCP